MPRKIIRVFISSTFSDFVEEREALREIVFPKLKAFCERNRATFQAVDLRWGISEDAALEHKTIDICLEEIERCKKLSPKPNFIVMLGDRYGWQPLPPLIAQDEFERIVYVLKNQFTGTGEDQEGVLESLLTWYKLDKNSVPPVYVLLNRSQVDQKSWAVIEDKLLKTLRKAVAQIGLSSEAKEKYFLSATGCEIIKGALNGDGASEDSQVFGFFREIDEIEAYVDTDLEKRNWLQDLKKRLKETLGPNIFEYRLRITKRGNVEQYLSAFCNDVEVSLTRAIEKRLLEINSELSEQAVEKYQQAKFLQERIAAFVGREDIIADILGYARYPSAKAFVLFGRRGIGKTSIAAKIVDTLSHNLSEQSTIIYRFVGATPQSSSVFSMLKGLCEEIHECYNKTSPQVLVYSDTIQFWQESLKLANESRPLIIVIDALDQLKSGEEDDELAWLNCSLPKYVSIILITREGESVGRVKNKLQEPIIREILPLEKVNAIKALEQWLSEKGRTLNQEQFEEIVKKYMENGLLLYLKFAFEQVRKWRSFESKHLTSGINGIIGDYLSFLSEDINHGQTMVAKTLGYLATSKNGLSESEMIEILSLDHSVMNEYFRRTPNSPEVESLPFIVWSRLYFDIVPYLKEAYIDNNNLMQFYHMQVDEAVRDIYLRENETINLHKNLAGYFMAFDNYLQGNSGIPNLRKLSELPYHLMRALETNKLFMLLIDPLYMKAKTDASRLYQLTDEMYWVHLNAKDQEVSRKLTENLFAFVAEYNYKLEKGSVETNEKMPILWEDIHTLLVYKKDKEFYNLFFQIGKNKDRILELCPAINADYIERLHLECLTKLLNYNRRMGYLTEAESLFREILPKLEADSTQILDYSRALYDYGYILYLQGNFDQAFAQLIKSADISEVGGNIVGKWISLCVGFHIRMISSLWTNNEKQYISEFREKLFEGLRIFQKKSSTNSGAKRWIMNVNAHLLNLYFLEKDFENASKHYIEFINDPWVKSYDDESFVLPHEAKLAMLKGEHSEAARLYKRYIDSAIVNSKNNGARGIESFAEHYYWYGQSLYSLGNFEEARNVWQIGQSLSDEPGNHKWRRKMSLDLKALEGV